MAEHTLNSNIKSKKYDKSYISHSWISTHRRIFFWDESQKNKSINAIKYTFYATKRSKKTLLNCCDKS